MTRINLDASGKRATGVTFVDTSGEEWEQPADLVILSAFTIFNVQLLLLSGIGTALRSGRQQGRHRPQLHPPDDLRRRSASSTRTNSSSIPSSPPARSACASTSSTATISITARSASSAAATWGRCRPTAGRSRPRRCRRARRDWGAKWKRAVRGQLSEHAEAGHRRARQHVQLPRRLPRSRPAPTRIASADR